jgi:hypothetical protein
MVKDRTEEMPHILKKMKGGAPQVFDYYQAHDTLSLDDVSFWGFGRDDTIQVEREDDGEADTFEWRTVEPFQVGDRIFDHNWVKVKTEPLEGETEESVLALAEAL